MPTSQDYENLIKWIAGRLEGKVSTADAALRAEVELQAAAHITYGLLRIAEAIEALGRRIAP